MKVTDDTRRVDGSTLSRTQTLPEASYRGGRVAPRRRVSLASFKSLLGLFLAGVLGAAASDGAFAKYPDKPVRMLVAYPTGGATDIVARAVALNLGQRLGQPIIVENRPGAGGRIGTAEAARATPDGYTLIFAAAANHSTDPHLYDNMKYDARKGFEPVGLVGYLPVALIVTPKIPAKTVAEFVALAKQRPGNETFASFGVGSLGRLAMELLELKTDIKLLNVPFQGAAPAITAIMGGQVDAMMVPLTLAKSEHKAGMVRMLGVATPVRFSQTPDIPTFLEQGIDLTIRPWLGILGPANMPADVVTRLNDELNAVLKDPKFQATLRNNDVQIAEPSTPKDYAAFLNTEFEQWGKIIREAGLKVEEQ